MSTQLHLALGIVDGRAHATQDPALLRSVELARVGERRSSLRRRLLGR